MPDGKYLYCIISESRPQRFSFIGINNREVKIVPYKDISAVVSDTPIINFDRLDKKELTKHVACHQKVNEGVMKNYDICPMTFGIIAPSGEEVLRILERAYLQFKTALKKIGGKTEFTVQVRWDKEGLLLEILPINPEVMRKDYIKDIQAILGSIAYDSTLNKLIDDEMLANFSFLIEKARESELDKKMQELGKRYEEKLRFKYIGPMPPYSFANINLSLGNFELVNEARKLLGLGEEATFDEIRKAYYELSHRYHSDKLQGNEEQMKKITQAYSILESYCRSCDDFSPSQILGNKTWEGKGKTENQKYSFKEEDIKKSVMIKQS